MAAYDILYNPQSELHIFTREKSERSDNIVLFPWGDLSCE